MIRTFKRFIKNEDGNLMFMTAGMALPLLALIGGAFEYSEVNKLKHNIQTSADNAVIAAFRNPRESWTLRQKRVNGFFKANLINEKRLNSLNTKLAYHTKDNATVMTFTISAGVNSLFGEASPFSLSDFTIQATAEYAPATGRAPHLVENTPTTRTVTKTATGGKSLSIR